MHTKLHSEILNHNCVICIAGSVQQRHNNIIVGSPHNQQFQFFVVKRPNLAFIIVFKIGLHHNRVSHQQFTEVDHVEVHWLKVKFAGVSVHYDRCVAHVVGPIRSAIQVQTHVPIDPTRLPVVQAGYYVVAIQGVFDCKWQQRWDLFLKTQTTKTRKVIFF